MLFALTSSNLPKQLPGKYGIIMWLLKLWPCAIQSEYIFGAVLNHRTCIILLKKSSRWLLLSLKIKDEKLELKN